MNIDCTIEQASSLLKKGKLVAIPTETVYGLAANALDPIAVANIFAAKGRPSFNPVIVHLHHTDELAKYATITPLVKKLSQFWPGPLTILLPHNNKIPAIVTAGSSLCGFRIPNHILSLELLNNCNFPLAAPSANISNRRSPTTAQMVSDQLGSKIDGILNGGTCKVGIESTVVELVGPSSILIHRPGGITKEDFEKIDIKVISKTQPNNPNQTTIHKPVAPGQLSSHYAPSHPLILLPKQNRLNNNNHPTEKHLHDKLHDLLTKNNWRKVTLLGFNNIWPMTVKSLDIISQFDLSTTGILNEAASNLFSYFDQLDQSSCDVILAIQLPERNLGVAINDRLKRAASYILTVNT